MKTAHSKSTPKEIRQVVGDSHLFRGLPPEFIEEIAKSTSRKTVGADEILFQKGDRADALWGVLSGSIVTAVRTADGKELVLDAIGEGEVFGEVGVLDFGPRRVEARAVQESQLFRLERKDFLKHLHSSPELCFRVFALLCSHLRGTTENLEDTALHKLPNRLAKRLTLLATDSEASDGTTLNIVQSDLASVLGVHRQAVNRHLRKFEKDGLIVLKRQLIEIVDGQALAALASPGQIGFHADWGTENLAALEHQAFTFSHPHESSPAPQESHSVGLLAIDAADYSRSLIIDASGTLKQIEAGFNSADRAIKRHQGRTIWRAGDRVLAEFPDAERAMQAALAIQDQVNPSKQKGKRKRDPLFCVGVHRGEVFADDRRYSGEAVNTVIRLTQLSDVGGIAISGAVREALDKREHLELQFLGDHELKNVSRAVPVYSARAIPLFRLLALRAETLIPRRLRLAAASAAAVVVAGGIWLAGDWVARQSTPPAVTPLSIAVLPFDNGGDTSLEYLAQGIPAEVRTSLSKNPNLRVIGRESSDYYSNHAAGMEKISRIGEKLNVAYVVKGDVHADGDRLSITAQLIKAGDGIQLWARSFDRTPDDIFDIKNEIAVSVVDKLKAQLLGALAKNRAADPEAYALFLRGRFFENLGDRSNRLKAFGAYQNALAIDPEYAPAWTGIAMHYQYLMATSELPRDVGYLLSLEATEKALAADNNLAAAWCGLGYIRLKYDWNWEGARTAFEKALQLDPNFSNCVGATASLAWVLGQSAKHVRLREKAVDLDPLSLSALSSLGQAYMNNNRPDEALEIFEKIVAINPDYPKINEKMGRAYLKLGDAGRALIEFDKYMVSPRAALNKAHAYVILGNDSAAQETIDDVLARVDHAAPYWTAAIYAWLGDNDKAFEWLELAYQRRSRSMSAILTNPYLTGLQNDPRYLELLEKMDLAEAWIAMATE